MSMRNTSILYDVHKYTGCVFAIAPVGYNNIMLAVYMDNHQSINNVITLMTVDTNSSKSVAVITYRERYEEANSSLDCHIDSLEVYRGRQQVTEIRHNGFSINENGSIEVIASLSHDVFQIPNAFFFKLQIDQEVVVYNIEDFKGELYRMNVTCNSSDNITRRGCLFFKVIGVSNITRGN